MRYGKTIHRVSTLLILLLLSACRATGDDREAPPAATDGGTVVLVHGMGRTSASMIFLSHWFRDAGYRPVVYSYRSSSRSFCEISDQFVEFIRKNVKTSRYHLVGHSLGNVIIRDAFRKGYPPGLARIVMLAPPNRPAHLANLLRDNPLYNWLTGDSGRKLSEADFYRDLPIPDVEFGVIAGDRGQKFLFNEPNDGIVAVRTTRLDGMSDFVIVHHTHTFIMNCRDTFEHCQSFIEHGRFQSPENGEKGRPCSKS